MTSLKLNLSRLILEAYKGRHNTLNQFCTSCGTTRHAVKLCASCLARMNVKSAEAMGFLRSIISQFVTITTCNENASPQSELETEAGAGESVKVSIKSIVRDLKGTRIFEKTPELQEHFKNLIEKIDTADTSCYTCHSEIKSLLVLVKKLLVLDALGDDSNEIKYLIDLLVFHLLETKFTCEWEPRYECEEENSTSASENHSLKSFKSEMDGECSAMLMFGGTDEDIQLSEMQNCTDNILNTSNLDTSTNLEYLKIAHFEGSTESENEIPEISPHRSSATENGTTCSEINNLEKSFLTNDIKYSARKEKLVLKSQNSSVSSSTSVNKLPHLDGTALNNTPIRNILRGAEQFDNHPVNEVFETNSECSSTDSSGASKLEDHKFRNTPSVINTEDPSGDNDKKIYKDKNLRLSQKVWRSLESLLKPRKNMKIQKVVQIECQPTSDKNPESASNVVPEKTKTPSRNIQNQDFSESDNVQGEGNGHDSDSDSKNSSSNCSLQHGLNGSKRCNLFFLILYISIFLLNLHKNN